MRRVNAYINAWKKMGYADDIPDECPDVLMRENLAPSYKAIALAILRNDLQFLSLGFVPRTSEWYGALKRMELQQRGSQAQIAETGAAMQLRLF